jgi:hypothetical protein
MKQMQAEPPKETRRYSYVHYNVMENKALLQKLLEYVPREEIKGIYSDYINRINKHTNSKRKIVVVTRGLLFIFSLKGELKERYPLALGQISRVQVNALSNHFNLIESGGINEVLQSIRKEELLLFMQMRAQALGKALRIDYVKSIGFLNSSQKQTILDPLKKKSVNSALVPTFNYAIKRSCVGYAVIESNNKLEALFANKDFVLVLSDLFVVGFSTVEFTLKFVLPLVGSSIMYRESRGKDLLLAVADGSQKLIRFNNDYEQSMWVGAIGRALERLNEESKLDTSFG